MTFYKEAKARFDEEDDFKDIARTEVRLFASAFFCPFYRPISWPAFTCGSHVETPTHPSMHAWT